MKTTAILVAALALSLSACAVEEDYTGELGPRPAGKPSLDPTTPPEIDGAPTQPEEHTVSISESFEIGTPATPKHPDDDGRLEWAVVDGDQVQVHSLDPILGTDEITTYSETGEIIVVTIRDHVREEIETSGLK